ESGEGLLVVEPRDDRGPLALAIPLEVFLTATLDDQHEVLRLVVASERSSQPKPTQTPVHGRRRVEAPGRSRDVVLAAVGSDERPLLLRLEVDRAAILQLDRARAEAAWRIECLDLHPPNSSRKSFELTKLNRNLLSLFGRKSLSRSSSIASLRTSSKI